MKQDIRQKVGASFYTPRALSFFPSPTHRGRRWLARVLSSLSLRNAWARRLDRACCGSIGSVLSGSWEVAWYCNNLLRLRVRGHSCRRTGTRHQVSRLSGWVRKTALKAHKIQPSTLPSRYPPLRTATAASPSIISKTGRRVQTRRTPAQPSAAFSTTSPPRLRCSSRTAFLSPSF